MLSVSDRSSRRQPESDARLDGREVLMQVANGYIQWQYVGDQTWNNLIRHPHLDRSARSPRRLRQSMEPTAEKSSCKSPMAISNGNTLAMQPGTT
ncbi:MAG: hypothetical protein MZU97_25840 [Bacillus subtilis]|nr:hypothetical protein [Bacillus subtilis]